MSVRNLNYLFEPVAVAVVGAASGLRAATGRALAHNVCVLNLVRGLGFSITPADGDTMSMRIDL